MRAKYRNRISTAATHAFLILLSIAAVFPFFWMVVSATNTSLDVVTGKMTFGANLADNYQTLLAYRTLSSSFLNSIVYSTLITVLSLLISSMAGFAFVVYRSRGKNAANILVLLSMMVPSAATLIPLFRLFGQLKLVNTALGYMLPSLATGFLIFMFRQSTQTFPLEIIQAARIDGLPEWRIFLRIYAPIMKPTYAAAMTITFMNAWNAFLWPLVIMQDTSKFTMPIFVNNLMGAYFVDYGAVMLAVTITTLPTVIIFFVLQKSFVAGLVGSIKA